MKRTPFGLLATILTALLTACSNESDITEDDNTLVSPVFHTSIDVQASSRAYDATWESGDEIGVFMVEAGTYTIVEGQQNIKYTYSTNSGFTSKTPIYFPANGSTVDFIAYYPYQETIDQDGPPIDISDQSSQKDIDFMYAQALSRNKNTPKINLVFSHKLAKIEVKLEQGDLSLAELNNASVSIVTMNTKGTLLLRNGNLDITESPETITMLPTNAHTFEAIVFSNTDREGDKDNGASDAVIKITTGNDTYKCDFPWKSENFMSGDKYIYTITVKKQ